MIERADKEGMCIVALPTISADLRCLLLQVLLDGARMVSHPSVSYVSSDMASVPRMNGTLVSKQRNSVHYSYCLVSQR